MASPSPFWAEVEAAFQTVSTYPHMEVTVERGDKTALVKYVPDRDATYIKITDAPQTAQAVELNPDARKEA